MCGMCGLLGGGRHWSNTVAAGESVSARRQRYVQVAHANRVLKSFRLKLADFHGQSFVLSSPTGAQMIVETMLGRPLDPLTMFAEDEAQP
jgi:hypothetical protein